MSAAKHYSRGFSHLGMLGAKLKDLQGYATLAHELIQNADDVEGVTEMAFDVREDALWVENNGVFSDCGDLEAEECTWKSDSTKNIRCDFHRFRSIGAADKRDQEETTGAFGIGFISVLQITDRPQVVSAGRHWTICEELDEDDRIQECDGCALCLAPVKPNTRFILPWAREANSVLRKGLRSEAVPSNVQVQLLEQLQKAIPTAMLFLKRVNAIEIRHGGQLKTRFERLVDGDSLILTDGVEEHDQVWYLLRGNFDEEARRLRSMQAGRIEDKRHANVVVALRKSQFRNGRLCAVLPTEQHSGLPFHINADFFPSSDRKRIVLDSDYQSEWNRAALKAAAAVFGSSLATLRALLGHGRLWGLLSEVQVLAEESARDERPPEFGGFWDAVEGQLSCQAIVWTTRGEWKQASETALIEREEEERAMPLLESLAIHVVHRDLRRYFGLLRSDSVGVPLVTLPLVCTRLRALGLNSRRSRSEWPTFLQAKGALPVLWNELSMLMEQSSRSRSRETDLALARNTAVVLGDDGALWPASLAYTADEPTRMLFGAMLGTSGTFASHEMDAFGTVLGLCPHFDARSAVECLGRKPAKDLCNEWRSGTLDLGGVFVWLENHREQILGNATLKQTLAQLPVFPSSGELRKLTDLALPGNFTDPLNLASLVDLNATGGHRDFLRDLGMRELDITEYARVHLPAALLAVTVSSDLRRGAAALLAENLGKLSGDENVRTALRRTRLVECDDGEFRTSHGVYFHSEIVRECMGDTVHYAQLPDEGNVALRDFYKWLGVLDEPDFKDLVALVRKTVSVPFSDEGLDAITRVFGHLASRLKRSPSTEGLEPLRTLAWLPGSKERRWYAPSQVKAVFREYLFSSQACFLGLSSDLQKRSTEFLAYLEIDDAPETRQVVLHLLNCSSTGTAVNTEVYRYLNEHVADVSVSLLKDRPCLMLPGGEYVSPLQVFWGEHPFGHYRRRLGADLRRFNALFDMLGVRETPDHTDALAVLGEVTQAHSKTGWQVDDEERAVVLSCWEMLQQARQGDQDIGLSKLSEMRCVPNQKGTLELPRNIFFEHRGGFSRKFGDFLGQNVIPRPVGADEAMLAAGVRPLREAVEIEVLESAGLAPAPELAQLIRERRTELATVLHSVAREDDAREVLARLEGMEFESAGDLKIRYRLRAFGRIRESEPETVSALLAPRTTGVLWHVPKHGVPPWPAIARELALALFPDEDSGSAASCLNNVLSAATTDEAKDRLSDLGFDVVDVSDISSIDEMEPVDTVGQALETLGIGAPMESPPSQEEREIVGPSGGRGKGPIPGKPKHGRQRGKLRTYVSSGENGGEAGSGTGASEENREIDRAGVASAMRYEEDHGRKPNEMPHTHEGYDIESYDGEGQLLRYVEVKSVGGEWSGDGVALTKPQFEKARREGERYWLYVVEEASTSQPIVRPIQDPAGQVNQYFYDDGWRALAEVEGSEEDQDGKD